MGKDSFKLPGASLGELEKIIEAFSQKGSPASNDEIAKLVGTSPSTVSRCNGFLIATGIIDGGKKKETTELGKKLGLALHHSQGDDVRKFWKEVIVGNDFLSEQVTAVRVQKAVKVEELPPKILYNSGSTKNQYSEIGSRTVADILARAGLLVENDDIYTVPKGDTAEQEKPHKEAETYNKSSGDSTGKESATKGAHKKPKPPSTGFPLQFAVNIQIQIQEFDDTSKYDDLFKALRKHLMPESNNE